MLAILLQDACNFSSVLRLYEPAQVISCLQTIPLDAAVFSAQQDFLELYMGIYVHEAEFAGSDRDVRLQLAALRERFEFNASATFFDYQNAVQAFADQYEDPHVMYQKPSFFALVNQASPFALARAGDSYVFKVTSTTSQVYYIYCKQVQNISTFQEQPIKTVNGIAPAEFIAYYARKYEKKLPGDGTKVNRALELDFTLTYALTQELQSDYVFDVELESGEKFALQRLVALNFPISSDAVLLKLYSNSLKENPYSGAQEVNGSTAFKFAEFSAPAPGAHYGASISQFTLINYVNNFYALYQSETTSDFVLQVGGFNPADYDASVYKLLDGLQYVRYHKTRESRLFVSLVMNGGGNPTLAQLMARVLLPGEVSYPKMVLKDSALWRLMGRVKSLLFQFKFFDYITDTLISDYYGRAPAEESPLARLNSAKQQIGTFLYSQHFNFDVQHYTGNDLLAEFEPLDFEPNYVIVLTDGTCMSAAGYFAQALKRKRVVFAGAGQDLRQFCLASGGVFFGNVVYEYAVRNILTTPSQREHYSEAELYQMQQHYFPHDGMFGVTVFSSHGFGFSQDVSELDFAHDEFDLMFPTLQLLYPDCVSTKFLDYFAPLLDTDYSDYAPGKVCREENGVVYREFDGACSKYDCADQRVRYDYGDDFLCQATFYDYSRNDIGYIAGISVLGALSLALIVAVVWLALCHKKTAKSGLLLEK